MGRAKFIPDWLVPVAWLTGLSLALLLGRFIATGTDRLFFLYWNLILAWLPLLFAYWLRKSLARTRWLKPKNLILTFLWFVFLPNSFYIVTDFEHLAPAAGVSLMYDSVLIMTTALAGLIVGCMSINLVHTELKQRVPKRRIIDILGSVFLLAALAIYLGRVLDYNTWDILANPFGLALDLGSRLSQPGAHGHLYSTTLLFWAYISVSYISFYRLIHRRSVNR